MLDDGQRGDSVMTDEERWRRTAARVREGIEIDPDTAEVKWVYGVITDPYDDVADFLEADRVRTLVYFARRPGGNWVCFDHLPDMMRDTLRHKHNDELAFAQEFCMRQHFVDRCHSMPVRPSIRQPISDAAIDEDFPF
jgi:hypothetical protein